jgi:hypothetical protein
MVIIWAIFYGPQVFGKSEASTKTGNLRTQKWAGPGLKNVILIYIFKGYISFGID